MTGHVALAGTQSTLVQPEAVPLGHTSSTYLVKLECVNPVGAVRATVVVVALGLYLAMVAVGALQAAGGHRARRDQNARGLTISIQL